ncbi:MAG: hypothetical protein V1926_04910 [Candidatus Peregrinibacteria bacterium]
MPLKHATETRLVALLAGVMMLTGFLLATLPDLPEGVLPWGLLFLLTVLYPLSLFRLLKRTRADYPFRWLHWFPACIVILWFILSFAALFSPIMAMMADILSFGFVLPLVCIGILLLVLFCLRVLRRRAERIVIVSLLFVPFTALAWISEVQFPVDRTVAGVLWRGEWWKEIGERMLTGSGGRMVAVREETEKNLEPSTDKGENAWRDRLRVFERRRQRIERSKNPLDHSVLPPPGMAGRETLLTGTGREMSQISSLPSRLPGSGPELAGFLIGFVSVYAGVLHDRSRRRVGN